MRYLAGAWSRSFHHAGVAAPRRCATALRRRIVTASWPLLASVLMKIGVLVKPSVSNAIYRAIGPMLALGERGHEVVLVKRAEDGSFSPRQLVDCDVVHVYRGSEEPRVVKGVAELWRRGIPITWDDDDDVRLLPPDTPGYKAHYGGLKVQQRIRQQVAMTATADVVTTTTQTLADLFGKHYDGPTEVIENHLDSSQYARDVRRHDGITIGWVASLEHVADVRMLDVTTMLRNVLARDHRRAHHHGRRQARPRSRPLHLRPASQVPGAEQVPGPAGHRHRSDRRSPDELRAVKRQGQGVRRRRRPVGGVGPWLLRRPRHQTGWDHRGR